MSRGVFRNYCKVLLQFWRSLDFLRRHAFCLNCGVIFCAGASTICLLLGWNPWPTRIILLALMVYAMWLYAQIDRRRKQVFSELDKQALQAKTSRLLDRLEVLNLLVERFVSGVRLAGEFDLEDPPTAQILTEQPHQDSHLIKQVCRTARAELKEIRDLQRKTRRKKYL